MFTCGDRGDIWAIKSHLETALKAQRISVTDRRRGLIQPQA
ncbi:MAG: hypothetical protein ABF370_01800 [Verrucomicrobiales bacterium]